MPPPLRIEYAGACYHLMSRGDRREEIFRSGVAGVASKYFDIVTGADDAEVFEIWAVEGASARFALAGQTAFQGV